MSRAALAVTALVFCACETSETRAWEQRRAALERRKAELTKRSSAPVADAAEVRAVRELPGLVRERGLAARVFVQPGALEVMVSGTAEDCRDVVRGLDDVRWLLPVWRLRIEGERCTWGARTGDDFPLLEQALLLPAPRWAPPPASLLSRRDEQTRAQVASLTDEVAALEVRLGSAPARAAAARLIAALRAREAPCELEVVQRELALEPERRGALLEVEDQRLLHPLEPANDFRLRGLVSVADGKLSWRCPAPQYWK